MFLAASLLGWTREDMISLQKLQQQNISVWKSGNDR